MKKIIINESQKRRIFEGNGEGFSIETLNSLSSGNMNEEQYSYCEKTLGQPYVGTSRCVFNIDDNKVLKLAVGGLMGAGIEQNKFEYENFFKTKSPLLPIIYDSNKDFTYLIAEKVTPASSMDFERILGIPFWYSSSYRGDVILCEIMGYIKDKLDHHKVIGENENLEAMISENKWLNEFQKLVFTLGVGDFTSDENFGIANRGGNEIIVLLDSGMNLEIYNKYYVNLLDTDIFANDFIDYSNYDDEDYEDDEENYNK